MPVNGLQRSVLVGEDQFLKLFQYGLLTLSRKVSDYIINSIAILFGELYTIRIAADLVSGLTVNYDIGRDFLRKIDRL